MSKAFIVHIMVGDKFTLPLIEELNNLFEPQRHHFLVLGQANGLKTQHRNTTKLQSPFLRNVFQNVSTIAKYFHKADLIVMHGIPALHYFLFFPFALKKLAWVIYGGTDLYLYSGETLNNKTVWFNRLRKWVLKDISIHLTHIEGDYKLANQFYNSKAAFIYHPVYLSNVVESASFLKEKVGKFNVLVGHSTDTSNNHIEIFEWLRGRENVQIFCPLSYGRYEKYKLKVRQTGFDMFGDRFTPIEDFMQFEQYKEFLKSMDIAIFNHKRQEAMGVTLTLLSLGKEVYVNNSTTSYKSFTERGFQIFDNELVSKAFDAIGTRDVSKNASLLQQYYSKQVWENQWRIVYNLKSFEQ